MKIKFSESYLDNIRSSIKIINDTGYSDDFSYPFIPNIDLNKKIAVVGLEPKKWVNNLSSVSGVEIDIYHFVDSSCNAYSAYTGFKNSKSGFGGLINKVSSLFNDEPVWLNFFAFSYKERTMSKMKAKDKKAKKELMDYSVSKIIEELKILNPDVIIFAGSYFNKFSMVANGYSNNRLIISGGFYSIEKWGDTLTTRVPHPASRVPDKSKITNSNLKSVFEMYSKFHGTI